MTRKQIDQAREIRLWVGQIVVPTIVAATTVLSIPEVRQAIAVKANCLKESIEKKIKKN